MTRYLVQRSLQMLVVLCISTVVIYQILSLVPGGPLDELFQNSDVRQQPSPDDLERLTRALGLDKPWYLQYLTWLAGDTWLGWIGFEQYAGTRLGILRGDWGESWRLARGQPVLSVLAQRLPNTLSLSLTAAVISIALAIPLGIIAALRQYSWLDHVCTLFSFLGTSLPSFWFGLLLISATLTLQANGLFYLPPGDVVATRNYHVPALGVVEAGSALDRGLRLILPVTVVSLLHVAAYSRYLRASMLDVLQQEFVRTARAKGLHERVVTLRHVLRNALLPLITLIAGTLPSIWTGALISEIIFNYKGMGWLYLQALQQRDWPIVMAFLLIQAVLAILANLLADLLYTVADPRIRLA